MTLAIKYDVKIIGILFLLLSICSGQISVLYAEDSEGVRVKKIGIEEFQIKSLSDNSNTRPTDSGAGVIVADIFYQELSSYQHYDLIAPAEMPFRIELVKVPETTIGIPLNELKTPQRGKGNNLREVPDADLVDLDYVVARAISRYGNTDLDAVVSGVVTRYDDRDGSSLAVKKPASVAFVVYLVSLKDKKIIWSGHFAETQVSLSENVLLLDRFMQAGGKWLNSNDLTQLVMRRAIKTFPGLRQSKIKLVSE